MDEKLTSIISTEKQTLRVSKTAGEMGADPMERKDEFASGQLADAYREERKGLTRRKVDDPPSEQSLKLGEDDSIVDRVSVDSRRSVVSDLGFDGVVEEVSWIEESRKRGAVSRAKSQERKTRRAHP